MRERLKALIMKMKEEIADTGDLYYPEKTVSELEAAISPQWVPVTERLPDTPRSVFVIDENEDGYSIGYYLGGYGWGGCDIYDENVTHWHEIEYPQPPEPQP